MRPHSTTAATTTPATNGALVLRDDHDGVVILRLSWSLQFNALPEAALDTLQRVLDDVAQDAAVHCVVLGAEGRALRARHDLREVRGMSEFACYRALSVCCSVTTQAIQVLPVSVTARVHGVATTTGYRLVGSCDLATASDTARFTVPGINVGLFCSTPAAALSRSVLTKHALNILVAGHFIDAATAVDWGLINEAVSAADLDDAVARKVVDIVSKSPTAIRYGKAIFYRQQQIPLTDAYAYAGDVTARNTMDGDTSEGIDVFLEKRPARWYA